MKDKKFLACFIFVAVLAFFLRFYELGKMPVGSYTDEIAMGYNAYSILKTGHDEYGQKFPLALRSFDDYKPPLASYAMIPAMMIFGKNEFSIRFPSALGGFLTVILVFAITQELFKKKWLSLTSGFLLAISPWHLQYSRTEFLVNFSLFWVVLGLWAFLKARKKGVYLLLSALSFGLSLYAYHAARLITPLLVVFLIILFWRDFLEKKKWLLISAIFGLLMLIPFAGIMLSKEGQMRPWSVSIFSETQPLEIFRERIQRDLILGVPFGNLWHNRRLVYLTPLLKSYFSQFRPEYLFVGDSEQHGLDVGLLYLWQIPFLFLGFHYLFLEKRLKSILLLIFWLVISPLPAALAKESPSSYRALPVIVPLQMIMAFGLFYFYSFLKSLSLIWAKLLRLVIVFLIFISFIYYLHMYYVHFPYELPRRWNYGGAQAAGEVKKMEGNYQKIIVSTELDEIYIYFLFYTDYDPQKYLNEGGTVSGGFNEMKNRMGKYKFALFDICKDPLQFKNTLLVWPSREKPAYTKTLKVITLPNGDPTINIGILDPLIRDPEKIRCN